MSVAVALALLPLCGYTSRALLTLKGDDDKQGELTHAGDRGDRTAALRSVTYGTAALGGREGRGGGERVAGPAWWFLAFGRL